MKKILLLFLVLVFIVTPFIAIRAQEMDLLPLAESSEEFPQDIFAKAVVLRTLERGDIDALPLSSVVKQVRVKIASGDENGKEVTAQNSIAVNGTDAFPLQEGDTVVLLKNVGPTGERYYATDFYRLSPLLIIAIVFVVFVLYFGRITGLMSLVGLAFSIGILAKFIVPRILAGQDPLIVSLLGSLMIVTVSLYLAHGWKKRTTVAYVSTIITLGISAGLAMLFVSFARLLGTGTEEAIYVQLGNGTVNLRGLLLGGIIIGALGVLDDITTAQSAIVDELHKANPSFHFQELYQRGLSVGKEHIAALVNTLALAYAGVGLPLFLLFALNRQLPLWVIVNGQDIAEEIVRTLVGSVALVLAVPIATALAAIVFSRQEKTISKTT